MIQRSLWRRIETSKMTEFMEKEPLGLSGGQKTTRAIAGVVACVQP